MRRLIGQAAAVGVTSALLVTGSAAFGAAGHHHRHAHAASGAGLVQQCIAAKAAGDAAGTNACEAASAAASPTLTPVQMSQLAALSQECRAAKAAAAGGSPVDMSACAEANSLVDG